jgi:hypothetical protein
MDQIEQSGNVATEPCFLNERTQPELKHELLLMRLGAKPIRLYMDKIYPSRTE